MRGGNGKRWGEECVDGALGEWTGGGGLGLAGTRPLPRMTSVTRGDHVVIGMRRERWSSRWSSRWCLCEDRADCRGRGRELHIELAADRHHTTHQIAEGHRYRFQRRGYRGLEGRSRGRGGSRCSGGRSSDCCVRTTTRGPWCRVRGKGGEVRWVSRMRGHSRGRGGLVGCQLACGPRAAEHGVAGLLAQDTYTLVGRGQSFSAACSACGGAIAAVTFGLGVPGGATFAADGSP